MLCDHLGLPANLPIAQLSRDARRSLIHAMVDPVSFGNRMVGLNMVPEPLWWLLGAVVGFYFGAREAHYFRRTGVIRPLADADPSAEAAEPNPALMDWRGSQS